ncbi:MAG: SpoIID/LytB domain-containing protein [Bacteroidales bacterium]|nr:SpoIID/LytB domain-containing protein [Bacteroidales bacterium]
MKKIDNTLLTTELHGVSQRRTQRRSPYKLCRVAPWKPRVTPWLTYQIFQQSLKIFIVTIFLTYTFPGYLTAQVRIRIFADHSPESAVFSVSAGKYEVNTYKGVNVLLVKGNLLVISKLNGRLAVKAMGSEGVICDSVTLSGLTGNDSFTLRLNDKIPLRQSYSGDLQCLPDFGTLLFINICDIESYIAGVVRAEGGSGKNPEYVKTQSIIARTYMYRYFDKHFADRFNLCDNTHCQAFNGITTDTLVIRAAIETRGLVILGPDTSLIISAFHSNCGGETAPSEDVWLSGQPYLRKVTDPYCLASRNALWQRVISLSEWTSYLKKNGFTGSVDDTSLLNFSQFTRKKDYKAGSYSIPLRKIREDLNFRSSFFSVTTKKDSVVIKGKGYGHGVGLCQEGAMAMASKGFDYKQIIEFYYAGVRITDIKNAVREK